MVVLAVRWNNPPSCALSDNPDTAVDQDIADDTSNEAVRDTVSEGHNRDRQERGNRVSQIPPVDLECRVHHH